MAGLPPAGNVMSLKADKMKADKGTFGVFTTAVKRRVTSEELKIAFQWYTTLKTTEHKTDNSDMKKPSKKDTKPTY